MVNIAVTAGNYDSHMLGGSRVFRQERLQRVNSLQDRLRQRHLHRRAMVYLNAEVHEPLLYRITVLRDVASSLGGRGVFFVRSSICGYQLLL